MQTMLLMPLLLMLLMQSVLAMLLMSLMPPLSLMQLMPLLLPMPWMQQVPDAADTPQSYCITKPLLLPSRCTTRLQDKELLCPTLCHKAIVPPSR